jgi:NAD-dependent DNA ligase
MSTLSHQEYINFLQRGIIVHSYLYYELDSSIISDQEFDKKSRELVALKNTHPYLWEASEYYYIFGDEYTGATGFHLYHGLTNLQKEKIRAIADILLNNYQK